MQTVSRQTALCRLPEPIDLERNSADAIAPAMTSSALLSHRSAMGNPKLPAPSQGELPRVSLSTTRRNQLRAQLPTAAVTSAASVFGGGTCFRTLPSEYPELPRGNGEYSHHLVDVEREILHLVFYSDTGESKE